MALSTVDLIMLKPYAQEDFDRKQAPVSFSGRCANGAGMKCKEDAAFTVFARSGRWALCLEHTLPMLKEVVRARRVETLAEFEARNEEVRRLLNSIEGG